MNLFLYGIANYEFNYRIIDSFKNQKLIYDFFVEELKYKNFLNRI